MWGAFGVGGVRSVHASVRCQKVLRVVAAFAKGLDPGQPSGGNGCWVWWQATRTYDASNTRCKVATYSLDGHLYAGLWIYDDYPSSTGSVSRCRAQWSGVPGYVLLAWKGGNWATNVGGAFMPELYHTGVLVGGLPEYRRSVYNATALQQWINVGRPGSPMVSVGTDAIAANSMGAGILAICRLASRGALGLYAPSQSFPPYLHYPAERMAWIVWALNECTRSALP